MNGPLFVTYVLPLHEGCHGDTSYVGHLNMLHTGHLEDTLYGHPWLHILECRLMAAVEKIMRSVTFLYPYRASMYIGNNYAARASHIVSTFIKGHQVSYPQLWP